MRLTASLDQENKDMKLRKFKMPASLIEFSVQFIIFKGLGYFLKFSLL